MAGKPPEVVGSYFPGDTFGELAMLYATTQTAAVVARTNCRA